MQKTWTIMLATVLAAAVPLTARADSAEVLTKIAAKASGALAMVSCKIEGEVVGREGTIRAVGICVNASEGWFMTLALSPTTQISRLKDFRLILPGATGKSLKAKLLGIDPATGISIVQATEAHKWKEVGFAPSAKLAVGQQVVSIGLLGGDGGRAPYLGMGYVSAVLRVPGQLAYVTGGKLTGRGSPVFAADGRAIGIVGRQQLSMGFQMLTGRGTASVRLSGQEETSFFLPVDEFVSVLRDPPTKLRRLAWIGATRIEEVGEELAGIIKLDRPGVMIDQVVPGHPADKAGLKNRDVIIAMDGKPLEQLATPRLVRDNFRRFLMRKKAGEKVALTVLRGTKTQEFSVTLGQAPKQAYEADRYVQPRLGFAAREKVEMDRYTDQGPTAAVDGLIVILVGPRTAAAAGGLKPGDLLTNCNDQAVKTVKVLQQIVEGAIASKPNEAINMLIRRGDQSMAISLRVPKPR